jgi:hypothetical protein
MYELKPRNKRGDLLAVFTSPMTIDKWDILRRMPKHSKRFEILLPNGYRLKFGEHKNILKQLPARFGDYVRLATHRYFQGFEE